MVQLEMQKKTIKWYLTTDKITKINKMFFLIIKSMDFYFFVIA